jgi:hypothetical protein
LYLVQFGRPADRKVRAFRDIQGIAFVFMRMRRTRRRDERPMAQAVAGACNYD